jgi:hypothetical protein
VQADPIATVPTASSARGAAVLQRESAGAQGGAPEQTQGGGAPEQTQDGGTAEEPQPQPEPPAAPGELEVSKTNIVLPDGVYMGSFTVSNVGGSSLEWTWSPGGFGISASPNAGTLAPGESVVVSFEVNPFAIPEGAFAYAASINSDAGSKHVTITGYREAIAVNPDLDLPDLDLTNDDGM